MNTNNNNFTRHLFEITVILMAFMSLSTAPAKAGEATQNDGPSVHLISPSLDGVVTSPVAFNVAFEANGAPVDPSSIRVCVKKFINIDITERVRAFVSQNGIQTPALDLPRGSHVISFSIADANKRVTTKTATIRVK